MPKLSVERLRAVLSYDARTGVFVWRISSRGTLAGAIAGSNHRQGYISITVDQEKFLAHRLAWFYVHGVWPANQIDHRDGDRKHNAIANLREATNQANQWNRKTNKPLKGIHFYKAAGRWTAQIRRDGKTKHLGYFDTAQAAARAYDAAALAEHGEFARINFADAP